MLSAEPGLQVLVPAGLERFEQPLAKPQAAGVVNGRVILLPRRMA